MFPADSEVTKQLLDLFAEIAERCSLTPVHSDDYDSMQRHTPGTAYPPSGGIYRSDSPAFSWMFTKPNGLFKTATVWYAIYKHEILCVLRSPASAAKQDAYGASYPGVVETVLKLWSTGHRPVGSRERLITFLNT